MNTSTVIDFIKARWCMIAILAIVSPIAIFVLLFVALPLKDKYTDSV